MAAFLFTLIATFLAGIGARDQRTLAQLTLAQGKRPGLIITALICAALASAAAAWGAGGLAPEMEPALTSPDERIAHTAALLLACFALGIAGIESLLTGRGRKPEEPTQSLGAAAIVLLAHQITDAARFLTFAIAVATPFPIGAGVGGALGSGAALVLGWRRPARFSGIQPDLRRGRRAAGVLLLIVALGLAVWTLRVAGRI